MYSEYEAALQLLARYAHERYINLDGRIERDRSTCLSGKGGKGAVVDKGALLPEGTEVAVKTIYYNFCDTSIKEGIREIHIWSKLRHTNILPFLGITTDFNWSISMISPWMEMGNAHDYVQDCAVDPRPLIVGIAHGLRYLHDFRPYPIYHGNLKGSNVLISQEGQALLCDFGISQAVNSSLEITLSLPGGGRLRWMAPEMLDGAAISAEGDVWAFGMTALELFTAKVPYHAQHLLEVVVRIPLGPPPRPRMEDTLFRLTDEWWKLCVECWNRDLASRPRMSHITGFFLDRRKKVINLNGRLRRDRSPRFRKVYAAVYKGTLLPEGTEVAVKTIYGSLSRGEMTLTEAARGIHSWTKLRHANILALLGVTTDFDLTTSIVCPWMDNGNAHDYVQDRSIGPRPLIVGIAHGLQYLHDHKPYPIYHGNLKGANVLISPEGQVLLCDFFHHRGLNSSMGITSFMLFEGIWNWAAPEVLNGAVASVESNVWAFGMTALELLTAKFPFIGAQTLEEIETRFHQGLPDRPRLADTSFRLTDEWWKLCCECWNRDPALRPGISHIIRTFPSCDVDPRTILTQYAHEKIPDLDGRLRRDTCPSFLGGFAYVYKGTLFPEGTEVAVKTILSIQSAREKTFKKAVREIHTWSKLRHDNILPLLGVTTEFDRTISVVSPWMNKGNAHEYVKDRAIDPFPLIIGIAHGLQYLHYHTPHPIYHGDLKGSNVLISPEGQALLCDFGLSLVTNSSLEMNLSRTHAGTLFWMAPELFNDCTASPEADVWAFGMTTLELFTAQNPFCDAQTVANIMARILRGPPPRRPGMQDTLARLTDE